MHTELGNVVGTELRRFVVQMLLGAFYRSVPPSLRTISNFSDVLRGVARVQNSQVMLIPGAPNDFFENLTIMGSVARYIFLEQD